jgi:tagaturonate reductase
MIPFALLRGLETVGDCMKDEEMSSFVKACVYEEIIPTLDLPYEELKSYADDVFERFENVFIRHYCSSISLNSVSKFKVRVLPSILEYIKRKGELPRNLIKSFAKLIAFYKTDMTNDDKDVVAFMKRASVREILANESLWGENLEYLAEAIDKAEQAISNITYATYPELNKGTIDKIKKACEILDDILDVMDIKKPM